MYKRQKLKRLVNPKPISVEVRELIQKRIAELEGRDPNSVNPEEYEALKLKHIKLVDYAEAIERLLRRQGVYKELMQLAHNLGLVWKDLRNLGEVTPKILDEWEGSPAQAHQFITMLEKAREIKNVERKLAEIRKFPSNVG